MTVDKQEDGSASLPCSTKIITATEVIGLLME
jgi:hypothetical protein